MAFRDWPILVPNELQDRWAAAGSEQQNAASDLAARILWALTGQVLGTVEVTARPVFSPQPEGATYRGFYPGLLNGDPNASGPCGCSVGCAEIGYDMLALPGPVAAVDEVVIDGVTVNPSVYRVDHRRWLHRVDGNLWPAHQDMHAADNEFGAFAVHYRRGVAVGDDGAVAAGRLAVELLSEGGGACQLPSGATSVTRPGVSVELADIREWFTGGLTGVKAVDLWIMAVNPGRAKQPMRVTSPDGPRRVPR